MSAIGSDCRSAEVRHNVGAQTEIFWVWMSSGEGGGSSPMNGMAVKKFGMSLDNAGETNFSAGYSGEIAPPTSEKHSSNQSYRTWYIGSTTSDR